MIWNSDHQRFIRKRYRKVARRQLLDDFNKKFDLDISILQLNNFLARFRKPVNDEIFRDGILYKKHANGKLKALHHILWEQHHSKKLGDNELVIFLDGNKSNLELANLVKVSRRQMGAIVGRKLTGIIDYVQQSEKLLAIIDMHDKLKR